MIRAFFALFPGEALGERYAAAYDEWTHRFRGLRWVAPRQVHLTVRFLGDTEEAAAAALRREAETAALAAFHPFRMALGHGGAFGGRGRPRTLWLGIDDGASAMGAVARELERLVRSQGWAPEKKPWNAHFTVARNPRGVRVEGWEDAVSRSGLPGSALTVENVAFVSSQLTPAGPVYTTLWNARLGGEANHPSQKAS